MKMPFGKYKDQDFTEIPTHYLDWIRGENMSASLVNAAKEEIARRANPSEGVSTKMPKHVFMEQLATLLVKCPDDFLKEDYFLDTPIGKFHLRIRKHEPTNNS